MHRTERYRPHDVVREDRPDGTILLRSCAPLPEAATSTGAWLQQWAKRTPEQVFLAERSGEGWRSVTYAEALQKVRALAASLLGRGVGADAPLAILSGNSVDHGLISLAAQYVGIPAVPLAEQYSLIPDAHGRLVEAIEMVCPAMVFVSDATRFADALSLEALDGIEVVASVTGESGATALGNMLEQDSSGVDAAHARVGPDTVAKILMTSGSTSTPKGVQTTHRMLCANQAQLAHALPFLGTHRPRIVDWLPWNHTFGGSHNFNLMLANGGSLYIDDGKPVKGLFDRTIQNLGLISGTMLFNVPVGYQMLLPALQSDADLRQTVFRDLDMIFYSGASLPQDIWDGLGTMAAEIQGEVPLMTSSWGMTETAPACVLQTEPTVTSGVVGAPLAGVEVKLLPLDGELCELRVKGPNVMKQYLDAPAKTAEAFDEEDFLITGDAMSLIDPDDPNRGLRFEGRISDDFKLATGTWVRATALRAEILACLAPLAADIVLTGHDRREIGLLVFPNREAMAERGYSAGASGGVLLCPELDTEISCRLRGRATTGSSTKVTRALVLADPPSLATGEITAKGNLNYRKILQTRATLVTRLYDSLKDGVTEA